MKVYNNAIHLFLESDAKLQNKFLFQGLKDIRILLIEFFNERNRKRKTERNKDDIMLIENILRPPPKKKKKLENTADTIFDIATMI